MNAFLHRNDHFPPLPSSLSFPFFFLSFFFEGRGFLSSFSSLLLLDWSAKNLDRLFVAFVVRRERERARQIYLLCNKTCFLRKRVREKEKKSLASNILSYVARNELYVNIRSSLFSKYVCIASFDGERKRDRECLCVREREREKTRKKTRDRETVLERASPSTIYENVYTFVRIQ